MPELWIIDSFADAPFSGNPAAVCMLPGHRPDAWHQALAGEMNQAATAFLTRNEEGWGPRWFNPRVELNGERVLLAGKARTVMRGALG